MVYAPTVEGGRIDHALHDNNGRRAVETVAFDNAIHAAIDCARETDPNLDHSSSIVTADHDLTLALNGYAKRTAVASRGRARSSSSRGLTAKG